MSDMGFDFEFGSRIVFGRGSMRKIPALLKELNASKVLIVTGQGTTRSGGLDKLTNVLREGGFEPVVFNEVKPSPTTDNIDDGARLLVKEGCDLVLAIGGGSALDAAKGVSIVGANGGSIADYFGVDKFSEMPVPMVAIPTTAGTGSEVSTALSVRDEATHSKKAVRSQKALPKVAVLDPELLSSLPERLAAESAMDALTHLIESYVSRGATPLTDMMSLQGIRLAGRSLAAFVSNRTNTEAAENMLFASLLGGIVISYARTGAAHTVGRPLGDRVSHGMACAIALPAVMEFNIMANLPKFCDIAAALGETVTVVNLENAMKAVTAVRNLNQRLGIPSGFAETGIEASELPEFAKTAWSLELSNLNPRDLSEKAILGILQAAM